MSSLSWLDYSDAERKRALQVLDLLSTDETRDELGLGTIRDAFADALFPGISTVQRRARYFLFVPWTFRDIERRFAGRGDALDRSRREELRHIEALLQAGETDGVIGSRARKDLRQLPSTIYWQGLHRWGIRRTVGSREQWARTVARSSGPARDDDGQLVDPGSWWHNELPEAPDDWPGVSSLQLRPDDARYLQERIRRACPNTMLSTLAMRREPWSEVPFAWNLDAPELPDDQRRLLAFARSFSSTMHGAALLYNHALAVASDEEELERHYRESLEGWAAREALADRSATPLPELWPLLNEIGSTHSPRTRTFVEDWFRLTRDPEDVLHAPALTDRVRARELEVKKRQARLSYDAARETWRGAAGAGQLDFRWSSAQRELLDIVGADDD